MTLEQKEREGGDSGRKSDKSHRDSATTTATMTSSGTGETGSNHSETGSGVGKDEPQPQTKRIDIDATINEASDLAEQTEHQRNKEQAAQRKGEAVEDSQGDGRGLGSKERMDREKEGRKRGEKVVDKNHERFE